MEFVITLIIGIAVAIVIYQLIHREIVLRASHRTRLTAQAQTDAAMRVALTNLVSLDSAHQVSTEIQSQPVADVWGRGVMTFEYQFQAAGMTTDDLPEVRHLIVRELLAYAQKHNLKASVPNQDVLQVTDIWLFDDQLHLEVTDVINRPTVEYLADLAKLKAARKKQP